MLVFDGGAPARVLHAKLILPYGGLYKGKERLASLEGINVKDNTLMRGWSASRPTPPSALVPLGTTFCDLVAAALPPGGDLVAETLSLGVGGWAFKEGSPWSSWGGALHPGSPTLHGILMPNNNNC